MPIKNRAQFFGSQWDLDLLSKNLGGRRAFSDIDAMTERRGKFLLIEFKHRNAGKIPIGQAILLKRFSELGDGHATALVVWGEPDRPVFAQIYNRGECGNRFAITEELLHNLIRGWDAWADTPDDTANSLGG